ncbi:MAG TPA: CusA/CzcA family heavy metal efflux RND transporter [Polyangiaceae bacterium]|nr:CusA/CzcA family heavy metal efflux RND transporter [Polyangiaceae bacterium]
MSFLGTIVNWSLNNRLVVLVAALLFTVFGLRSAATLQIDAVPDVTNVQVQIITTAPALSPVEVEQYVTTPVERAMAGLPKTTEVRSISRYGLSVVTVVFADGTDIYFARQLINERMSEAQQAVPNQYGRPEMGPISSGLGEIYQFTVKNPALTLMQLEELLDWHIAPLLRSVPGVVEVNSFGGEDRQYQVVLDPKRLQAAGVSVAEVANAIQKSNANMGGGYIEHNGEHFVIGTDGLVKSLDDLKAVVIDATREGVPITLSTVGDVQFGPRLRRGAASMDGEGETVIGVTLMLLGENSRTVTGAVKQKLLEIQPSLPPGTRVEAFYDRSVLVEHTIGTVARNLAEGAALVILVLFVLLGDLRAGLIVATTIPLAMLFAVTAMNLLGLSGNLMSLGAIDFGLIVDGAVIVVENTVRRMGEQRSALGRTLLPAERILVTRDAALEVQSASAFGGAIIAIVYLPILALTGLEGKLFRPMASTVLLALLGAFILVLTVIPVLTSYLVPKPAQHDTWLLGITQRFFSPLLARAIRHRALAVGTAVVLLAGALIVFTRIGAEFVPQLDEGDFQIEARRLTGAALSESVATDLRLEKVLLGIPEVAHAASRTGSPEVATDPMGLEQSDIFVMLKEHSLWRPGVTKEGLAQEIAQRMERSVPEMAGSVSQPIQMRTNELIAGVRSDVAVLVYGPDLAQLAELAQRGTDILKNVPGAVDVRAEQVDGLRYLNVRPNRAKLARYGLSVEDVNQIVETIAVGHAVGEVLEGDRRFGIVIKTAHGFSGDIDVFRALPLKSTAGQSVPLGDVADVDFIVGPAQVSREALSRRITVEFNVRGRDLLSVVRDAQEALNKELALPTGYHIEWGGQFQHYTEAKARLGVVIPLALGLIAFLLWMAFHSTRAAALIFLNVPFAIIGGVVALWVRDIPFSISAGVGFIALFGVAVLNGLVLVAFARQLQQQGLSAVEAIQQAATLRLRPVLMTALVASLGFLPMALSTAPGSEVQRPLATVVIGGLITATLLTLLVLPVLYGWFQGRAASSAHGVTRI